MHFRYDGHTLFGTSTEGDLVDMLVTEQTDTTLTLTLTVNGVPRLIITGMTQQVEVQDTSEQP